MQVRPNPIVTPSVGDMVWIRRDIGDIQDEIDHAVGLNSNMLSFAGERAKILDIYERDDDVDNWEFTLDTDSEWNYVWPGFALDFEKPRKTEPFLSYESEITVQRLV